MANRSHPPRADTLTRIRRSYFECRYGQLHVHHAIPAGGGFEERTALLALHAATSTGRMFGGLMAVMGADRSAFAPDLAGFGQSDAPEAPLSIADRAAAIGDFLDSMRLRQVDVLGCGLGALVAVELALARPGIRRVVVIPVPPIEIITAGSGPGPAEGRTISPSAAEATAGGRQYPLGTHLARLTRPVLALCPREMPPALAKELGLLPPHARGELPGGLSLFETAPGAVADAIKDFLND